MKYKSPRNGLLVHAYFLFIAFFLRLSLLDNLQFTYPMLFLFQNYDRQVAIAPFHAFLKLRVNAVQPASDGIMIVAFQFDTEKLSDVRKGNLAVYNEVPIVYHFNFFPFFGIKFIANFAYDFFQYVFNIVLCSYEL